MQAKLNKFPIQNNKITKVTHLRTRNYCFTTYFLPTFQASSSTKKLAINDATRKPKVAFVYVRVYIVVTHPYLQARGEITDRNIDMKELTDTFESFDIDSECDYESRSDKNSSAEEFPDPEESIFSID
jgi:hypothetical protein